MDVTHIPQFGRLSYVHVTIDTFSSMIWTMPLSGETTNYVITHLFEAFAVLGMPAIIKTENGPAYSSTKFQQFCEQYTKYIVYIKHVTGIE